MSGKYNISSASAKLPSRVRVKAISPKNVTACGFIMTADQAVKLATYVLAVAAAENADGLIYITGRPDNSVTVIRGVKGAAGTASDPADGAPAMGPPEPADDWERQLFGAAVDCGVSVPDTALSSDGLYE